MVERKFTVTNEAGEKLVCIEALPERNPAKPLPVAILCHGFAYYKEEDGMFTGLAERLVGQGYAVFYFDFSGCGESEGDYEQTTLTKLVKDLNCIVSEVSSYTYVDKNRLSLVGQSFGTAVIISAQITKVQRLVLCGSAANPRPLLQGILPEFDEFGISSRSNSKGQRTTIGPQFWADLKQYDLAELIANFESPILFVHGENDDIVPVENARALLKVTKNGKLALIPDSDHGLQPNLNHALDIMTRFFKG